MSLESDTTQQQLGESASRFQQRVNTLRAELVEIRRELARKDMIVLAHRCRRILRETRALLDSNVNVLFPDQSLETRVDLHNWLEYADEQIAQALSKEHEFEVIMQRLYMSVMLVSHVQEQMADAIEELRRRNFI
jgi:hypothetical protein